MVSLKIIENVENIEKHDTHEANTTTAHCVFTHHLNEFVT